MSVFQMYLECRELFPDIAIKADKFHFLVCDEFSEELSSVWFEALAKALNDEMRMEVPVKKCQALFDFMHSKYMLGDEKQKQCIDIHFVENLFWKVPEEPFFTYWQVLPESLKQTYVWKYCDLIPSHFL